MTNIESSRRFRHATMDDFEQIQRNYARARELMARNGNGTQWGSMYPLEDIVREDIDAQRTILLVDNETEDNQERILAQFALCKGEDPMYDTIEGAWLDNDEYVTIHRIASSGLAHHAAQSCIEWAIQNFGNVRADTHHNNKAMQHVLEMNGFARCGLIHIKDRATDNVRIAYQRHEW